MSIDAHWYSKNFKSTMWLPISWLLQIIARFRRIFYSIKNTLWPWPHLKYPVIIVGNISVGGTGKTPMVLWLVNLLKNNGYTPGIVSRGYGGEITKQPRLVNVNEARAASVYGDEPVLLARRSRVPVMVGLNRRKAARLLMDQGCDVVVSDDGMQHYNLPRDIEIAMIDGKRRFGNERCLPAGPLREPLSRLNKVNFIVTNGLTRSARETGMGLSGVLAVNVQDPSHQESLEYYRSRKVHAVAGIGNPQRFFDFLKAHGMDVVSHPFPDHHQFIKQDFFFAEELPVFMTEKDAVKCADIAQNNFWFVPVTAVIDKQLASNVLNRLKEVNKNG